MRASLVLIMLLIFCVLKAQVVPYHISPDWISTPNGHIATGLGLADINGDGWKDLVIANGNDIQRQRLVVYYNQGDGTFPLNPDWQSADIDYHGHLACGDLDADGDIDVVVSVYIGPSGFSSPGKLKIYYNQGIQLESIPSFESDPFYTFSCALGDADGDGDLDIAAVAGEPYSGILDKGKIFINNNGVFQPTAEWQSSADMGSLDVEFGDFNRDGFLDVIFVCEGTPNYIYLADAQGSIDAEPDWQSSEIQNFINSVDVGYVNNQSIVVMTENSQLGGSGKVRKYDFSSLFPLMSQASWYSNAFGYGSGIILNDVDLDGHTDLIYGGWWLPVKVALGDGAGFELNASYTSSTASVVEAILLSDLGREDELLHEESFIIQEAGHNSHVIILNAQITEGITHISRNGISLTAEQFCHVPGKPWISISQPLQTGDIFEVSYVASPYPDMVVTNWDSSKGNYIFYNTSGGTVGIAVKEKFSNSVKLYPNPARDAVNIMIPVPSENVNIKIYNNLGNKVYEHASSNNTPLMRVELTNWPSGVYLIVVEEKNNVTTQLFMKR